MAVELSYCVVNTEQRQLLRYCLDSIARERAAVPFETEVIVLDNASRDGSAGTARAHGATTEVIALEQRRGKGENDSTLLRRARGRYVLLLNDDAELEPGATTALHEALAARPEAAIAGATLVTHAGRQEPSAWRFPGPLTALLTALYLHRRFVVQSRGSEHPRRRLGAVGRAAGAPRRRRGGRLHRPRVLRLLRRGRLLQAAARRRLGGAPRPVRARRRPRAAGLRRAPPDRRALAQPRPLHAQAPRPVGRARACAG